MDTVSGNSLDAVDSDLNIGSPEGDGSNGNYESAMFDIIIGHIEDIIVDDEFQLLQRSFMEKYWHEFDGGEENKLIYTDIFNEYINVVENYIETNLNERVPDFSMSAFLVELLNKRDMLDGEVFDVLYTFSDFEAFKEMFEDYRAMKEGVSVDFSQTMTITPLNYEED